jgi:hypothetical protein
MRFCGFCSYSTGEREITILGRDGYLVPKETHPETQDPSFKKDPKLM